MYLFQCHKIWVRLLNLLFVILVLLVNFTALQAEELNPAPLILLPKAALESNELAVIVNDDDPDSLEIASYYQQQRHIPIENIIHVHFKPGSTILSQAEFIKIKDVVNRQVSQTIQIYALAWTLPYRVECMSITTAFAFGFNKDFCTVGCKPTRKSSYFNSNSKAPYTDFKIRPTMLLAGETVADVKRLIDRGVAADGTIPVGTAYLLKTSDKNRNVRSFYFSEIEKLLGGIINIKNLSANYIENKRDVLFYFTGTRKVKKIFSNKYLPGAIADHLTSSGGQLKNSNQMSSLEWLTAGATGSYGAVVEPCNILAKFPHPGIVMEKYMNGQTLIEAYWKSVAMPGQGVFIGEPLAKPFAGYKTKLENNRLTIKTWQLDIGTYNLYAGISFVGPYQRISSEVIPVTRGEQTIVISNPNSPVYHIQKN